jgi:putative oxygen-independent coproporphyrinogen III oxidase
VNAQALPPLSLYIHMPWCVRKCPYCDFNSHTAAAVVPRDRYVDALCADLESEAASARACSRPLQSIFIGGGTPSLFGGEHIARVLQRVGELFDLQPQLEVTMEANPGTVECGDLPAYRRAGVTRLSLGAQSFDAEMLQVLGRIHVPGEIARSFNAARAAGFEDINLDLMFALPGQSVGLAVADVERAIELEPSHISYYQLTLEPNTVFHSRPPAKLPDEDLGWEIQLAGQQRLRDAGFEQYEVSAFARTGQRCRHNLNYWQFGDYLGVGAGAHGKFTSADGRVWRYAKPAHPLGYMQQTRDGRLDGSAKAVLPQDLGFEFMLNALRLREGFTAGQFRQRTGLSLATLADKLRRAEERGLVVCDDGASWVPTALGWQFLNDLQGEFLPA